MLSRFYGPYARKLWGLSPEAVDVEQARVRVAAAGPLAIARRVLQGADPAARTFRYPRRGFGQISEALADDARAAGATVELDTAATSVVPAGDHVVVTSEDGRRWRARSVWSTIPLPVLARLVDGAPAEVGAAASRMRTRAMVLVYVVLHQPRLTRFDAHYLPEAWTPVTRLSEPKNYRDGHPTATDEGDPTDRTVLCAEVPCSVGDDIWRASPTALLDLVRTVLAVAGFPAARVADVEVARLPSAYPVYDRGFAASVRTVADWLDTVPGVLTFGRQGLFVHDNTHHALAMAHAAVDALGEDGRIDPAAWSRARAAFADHVVED